LFLLTEHFRPLGVVMIKLRHLQALVPTDEEIKDVYTSGSVMGENCSKKKNSYSESRGLESSDEEVDVNARVTGDDDLDTKEYICQCQRIHWQTP